jgi:hypothetical protein
MKYFILLAFVCFLLGFSCAGCGQSASDVSNQQKEQQYIKEREAQDLAISAEILNRINEFAERTAPGWKVAGLSVDAHKAYLFMEEDSYFFHIHLKKDAQEKVVSAVLTKFYQEGGEPYWYCYAPSSIPLGSAEIKTLK